jgi:hypothetical protein
MKYCCDCLYYKRDVRGSLFDECTSAEAQSGHPSNWIRKREGKMTYTRCVTMRLVGQACDLGAKLFVVAEAADK